MAESNSIPSNEEIINEIIKDIDSTKVDEVADENRATEEHSELDQNFETESENTDFHVSDDYIDEEELKTVEETLTEEQKEERRKKSVELKNRGNTEFKCGEILVSLQTYTEALRLCPISFNKDRSVLYSNRAACKIKLDRTEAAIEDCTKAIELDPNFVRPYLRRAKLYEDGDKLEESLEDYKKILEVDPGISEARIACSRLPPLIKEKQEKMKEEMLGKLKDLGNMILRPFGLSTDNFQLKQDPSSGGYSVNFSQNK